MKKHFLKSLLALSVAASMTVTFVPATYAAEVTAFDDSVDEEISPDEDIETVEEQTSVFPEDEPEIQIDEEADESDSDEIILDEAEPEEVAEELSDTDVADAFSDGDPVDNVTGEDVFPDLSAGGELKLTASGEKIQISFKAGQEGETANTRVAYGFHLDIPDDSVNVSMDIRRNTAGSGYLNVDCDENGRDFYVRSLIEGHVYNITLELWSFEDDYIDYIGDFKVSCKKLPTLSDVKVVDGHFERLLTSMTFSGNMEFTYDDGTTATAVWDEQVNNVFRDPKSKEIVDMFFKDSNGKKAYEEDVKREAPHTIFYIYFIWGDYNVISMPHSANYLMYTPVGLNIDTSAYPALEENPTSWQTTTTNWITGSTVSSTLTSSASTDPNYYKWYRFTPLDTASYTIKSGQYASNRVRVTLDENGVPQEADYWWEKDYSEGADWKTDPDKMGYLDNDNKLVGGKTYLIGVNNTGGPAQVDVLIKRNELIGCSWTTVSDDATKKVEACSVHEGETKTTLKSNEYGHQHTLRTRAIRQATAVQTGEEVVECTECGTIVERRTIGKLRAKISLTVPPKKTLPLKVKQSYTVYTANLTTGDRVVSWKSSNPKVVTVNSKGRITGKKAGTAKITVTLASGASAWFNVKVQKKNVTTTALKVVNKKTGYSIKKATLKRKQKLNLKTTVSPVTSKQIVTYRSSNSKVASVSAKGVIKAKKKGKAVITIRSGKKTAKCTITVK